MTQMETTAPSPVKRITDMPAHARVWVYKAGRDLGQAEQKLVRERGGAFTSEWSAHGAQLDACVDVMLDRFVVIAVDEEQALASGCSIDKSVGFIKQLEHDLNLMLTDRMLVMYERDGRVQSCHLDELPTLLSEGDLSGETFIFDDLVLTVADLHARFRIPLRSSWMERYL